MARHFARFLRICFEISDAAFRIVHSLRRPSRAPAGDRTVWLDTLGLPRSCLRKSTVNVYSKYSQKKRKGRLPYGTVRVCVHSTEVVQQIYGAIQEYGGFDRPERLG